MTSESQWRIGDYIKRERSTVCVKVTSFEAFTDVYGNGQIRFIAGGPRGYEGTQNEFRLAGWVRVPEPNTEGEQ